jgi:dihydrodipicolinate synthase/N-acetylneuraminate lyase
MLVVTSLSGTVAPVPTPLDAMQQLDPSALCRHLSWLADNGLDGALILGSNGEFPSFTIAERAAIAADAARCRAGLKLILNVGSCCLEEVHTLLSVAADNAYDAVLCPPPFYFRNAPEPGVAAFLRQVLDRSRLPVLLYHIPQLTGISLSTSLLARLADHPQLAGIKDSTGDEAELQRLRQAVPSARLLVGHDALVATCRAAGGAGSISAVASLAPRLVRAADDPAQQPQLSAVRAVLEEHALGPAVKAVLAYRGFGAYTTRPPLAALDPSRVQPLIDLLAPLGVPVDPIA